MKTKRCIAQRIPDTTQHVAAGCCNAALARSLIKIVEGTIDLIDCTGAQLKINQV